MFYASVHVSSNRRASILKASFYLNVESQHHFFSLREWTPFFIVRSVCVVRCVRK